MHDFDTTKAVRIGHRTTKGEGVFAKHRWTELALYFLREPAQGGVRFVAEIAGHSDVPGEQTRTSRLGAQTLPLAFAHFDDSAPARSVIEQAEAWLEQAQTLSKRHDDGHRRDGADSRPRVYIRPFIMSDDVPEFRSARYGRTEWSINMPNAYPNRSLSLADAVESAMAALGGMHVPVVIFWSPGS